MQKEIIYTHFMYIPIALASMWWGFWGLVVSAGLAALVLFFHLAGLAAGGFWNDMARIAFFPLVAFFIGYLRQRLMAGQEALLKVERKERELARKHEEQLEHSTRLAELGEMAAAISHELNQPLTGIRNYARNSFYMLDKQAGSPEEVKENLRLISEQVDRAAKIINQMRELTRRSDRNFATLDLNSVLRESVEFLLPQMKLSEVQVSQSLAAGLPPLRGDRIRLSQVFLNLLTNARQAMEGSATRELAVRSYLAARRDLPVVVQIADTGKGFSAEQAPKLFMPFFTTKARGHGTGLGLSISRSIMQAHQGTIEASGIPGRGATFTLRFPAAVEEDKAVEA